MRNAVRSAAPWAWALTGALAGAVVTLVLCAPAVWLQAAVNDVSEGRVRLSGSTGTVWDGSAQLALTGGAGSQDAAQLPGRVQWRVRASWSGLHIALEAPCCTADALQLRATAGWGSWQVHVGSHQSTWPAAVLAGLGTPWNTVQPEGALVISTAGFSVQSALARWTLTGDAQLEARDLSAGLSTLRPLGSYRLVLKGGAQPRLALSTLRGALQLSGQGAWTGARLHFEGEARAQTPHEPELANLLNIMGRRDGARSVISLG
jgi:general secretion pathway protein N